MFARLGASLSGSGETIQGCSETMWSTPIYFPSFRTQTSKNLPKQISGKIIRVLFNMPNISRSWYITWLIEERAPEVSLHPHELPRQRYQFMILRAGSNLWYHMSKPKKISINWTWKPTQHEYLKCVRLGSRVESWLSFHEPYEQIPGL